MGYTAKRDGATCPKCGHEIHVGDSVTWKRGGSVSMEHVTCPKTEEGEGN
jgi:hypothetical protein